MTRISWPIIYIMSCVYHFFQKCFGIFLPFVLLPTIEFKSSTKDRETKTQPTEKDITPRYYTLCSCRRDQKRIGLIDAIHSFYTAPAVKFNAYVVSNTQNSTKMFTFGICKTSFF